MIMTIDEIREKISPILAANNIEYAAVFGSVARGDAGPDSDVDLVVRIKKIPFGIWGVVGLKQDLEHALGKKVDVVSEFAINPMLAEKIKPDLKTIYERS